MKVLSSLKSAKNRPGCKIVRRHGVVYVISYPILICLRIISQTPTDGFVDKEL